MKILITGFDPFGGESVNPAYEAVKRLPDIIEGAELVRMEVPTVYGEASRITCEAMDKRQPAAVLCVGQAGGRGAITPERIAINCMDARIPDNAGRHPVDAPCEPGGPDGVFSTLPIRQICEKIREAGLPADISNTAGTFVCNELMYRVLRHAGRMDPAIPAGFIHVPFLPEQLTGRNANAPALPLDDIVRALAIAVRVIVRACGN